MTNKIQQDLENQSKQQHTIKDLAQLRTLSEEELEGIVGGQNLKLEEELRDEETGEVFCVYSSEDKVLVGDCGVV